MIYTVNAASPKPGKGFQQEFEYRLNKSEYAQKLTLNVRTEESNTGLLLFGPIIVAVSESEEWVFEETPFSEQYLELGFWSKTFATPITGWRIKVPEERLAPTGLKNLPGLVDMVAYG